MRHSDFEMRIRILNQGLFFKGEVRKVYKAKVAVFTSALDVAQTETKGTVLIKNAEEMLNFTSGEEKHMEKVKFFPTSSSSASETNRSSALHLDLQGNCRLWRQSHRCWYFCR